MTTPNVYRRPETQGILGLECSVCERINAHIRMSTGWQCLACKTLVPAVGKIYDVNRRELIDTDKSPSDGRKKNKKTTIPRDDKCVLDGTILIII